MVNNRCWLIGNGPSLKQKHLKKLHGETTFGVNMISTWYDEIEWRPTFYTAVTSAIEMPQYRPHILRGISECDTALVSEEAFYYLEQSPHIVPLDVRKENLFWSDNPYNKVCAWGMSHLVSFNFAIKELGVDEIYLVGFDLDFKPPVDGKDVNHFSEDYWDVKYIEQRIQRDPELLERTEQGHVITHEFVKEHAEMDGVRIYNCTMGGKLNVYPRRSFYKVLKGEYE